VRKLLVTGSSGLIGSEVVTYFCGAGWRVDGIDNNMRKEFFGPEGDTGWNTERLVKSYCNFRHHEVDMRDRAGVARLVASLKPDAIVHTAAQPSHDLAASRPYDDFDVNAVGTLNLLEAARRGCPESPFVHMSTSNGRLAALSIRRFRRSESGNRAANPLVGSKMRENGPKAIERRARTTFRSPSRRPDVPYQKGRDRQLS